MRRPAPCCCWPLRGPMRILGMIADSGPRDGAAVGFVASGEKRSAAFGTNTASSILVVTISAVAVMPGRNSSSGLSTSSMVSYVTTPVDVALDWLELLDDDDADDLVLLDAKCTLVMCAEKRRLG